MIFPLMKILIFKEAQEETADEAAPYLYDYEKNKSEKKVSALKMAIIFLSIVFIIFLVLLIYTLIKRPAMAEEKVETKKEIVVETKKEPPVPVIPVPVEKKTETVKKKAEPAPVKKIQTSCCSCSEKLLSTGLKGVILSGISLLHITELPGNIKKLQKIII